MKYFAFNLDLEADHAGQVGRYGIFKSKEHIEKLLELLNNLNVKITVFVVGEIFELYPDIIKIFQKYNCEFEAHSYSHKPANGNSDEELSRAKSAYYSYFKKYPKGYRAPLGKISDKTIELLEKHDFIYDSSIFPSYYPNPFRYLLCNRQIHHYKNSNILEIPLTVVTPFRLMLSLSYIKLFGLKFYLKLFKYFKLPDIIIFNTHLHDFIVNEDSHGRLPVFWKFIYDRNKYKGIEFCMDFLKYIREKKYQFCHMSEIYGIYKKSGG